MRILLVHNEYGRDSGEEHAVREVARLLEANGHEVDWFLRSSAEIRCLRHEVTAFFTGLHSWGSARRMRRLLSEKRFDVVQLQNLYPFISPAVLWEIRRHGLPIVMRCPNYRIFCPNGLHLSNGEVCERCLGGREWWCILRNCTESRRKSFGYAVRNAWARLSGGITRNVTVFAVLSEFQRKRFISGGIAPERLRILPNVVPFTGCHESGQLGHLVTFVGRVSQEKGIEDFVEAARRLPDLPFAVAGRSDGMPGLVENAPSNVRWLGFLGEEALNRLYLESRLLVFPSRWFEGFPNVITRAMALERPVIASRIGALPEIVDDGHSGLLFQPGDVTDLARKISDLHTNPSLCAEFGGNGRDKALTKYSEQAVYSQLLSIYESAIARVKIQNSGRQT